ncbi:hypothetical protein, partial [Citrobacter sp. AATXR]|uniref:hypothetical protein n=1 Tax=Citrobacter sp. AATXR TaxID=1779183 RepID=UPI000A8F1A13
RLRFSGPKTSIIRTPTTSLKTSIKTITNLSDTNCLEIQGASLEELKFAVAFLDIWQRSQEHGVNFEQVLKDAIQQATPNEDRKWVSIK